MTKRKGGGFSAREQVRLRVVEDYRAGRLSRAEAATSLGVSERTISRLARRVRSKGLDGLRHGNSGRSPANKLPDSLRDEVVGLVARLYREFSLLHALEMLALHHDIKIPYATLHGWCKAASLGRRHRRRSAKARLQRERMANAGFLLQMDGSTHRWNGRDEWTLVSLIDDATSELLFARFFLSETTWACMTGLRQVIEQKGLPCYLYTDSAGWAGGSMKRPQYSQFVRACEELGIGIIQTPHPQSKGRIERSYRTIQERLVPELELYGITTMLDANRYLEQCFVPHWNERFTVEPRQKENRYRPLPPHVELSEIFCMKYPRLVGHDHVVNFEGERYLILNKELGSLRGKQVAVHRYEDGTTAVFHGTIKLETGRPKQPTRVWKRQMG